MEKLALFGGEPVRTNKLPLNLPYFDGSEAKAAADAITSTFVSGDGPKGQELEERFCKYLGVKHAFFVNSCTAALELGLMVSNINSGSLISPDYTFTSTALIAPLNNLKLKLSDINLNDCNLSVNNLREVIDKGTKIIVPVHYAGVSCDMDEINKLARDNGSIVMEDAAHAIGAKYKGKMLGTISDMGCFSFHGTKNLVCGEGGLLVTNDDNVADKCYVMRDKGTNKYLHLRNKAKGYYQFVDVGRSFVQSDILAAVALEQLKKIDFMNNLRRKHANYLITHLSKFPQLVLPSIVQNKESNWHLFWLRVKPSLRDFYLKALNAEGISANIHYIPLHLNPVYQNYGYDGGPFTNSKLIYDSLIRIPLYPGLNEKDLNDIIVAFDKINNYLEENSNE